jgi:hypothetical protein
MPLLIFPTSVSESLHPDTISCAAVLHISYVGQRILAPRHDLVRRGLAQLHVLHRVDTGCGDKAENFPFRVSNSATQLCVDFVSFLFVKFL